LWDCDLRPAWTKSYQKSISANMPVVVDNIYISRYAGGIRRRITVKVEWGKNCKPLSEK
jgi:hypothetical protein